MSLKKKLLFVIPGLDAGGAEKSLVNLLHQIDFEQYEIDLFLFKTAGLFFNSLPSQVNILKHSVAFKKFNSGILDSCCYFLRQGQLKLFFSRILFLITNRWYKNKAIAEQQSWKYFSKSIPNLEKEYDAAIGFLEKSAIYFVVDKVQSKNKIGWIHTNYESSGMNPVFDFDYFSKLSHLVTVSEKCKNSLEKKFPDLSKRIAIIENIISPKIINTLAVLDDIVGSNIQNQNLTILTIARLSHEKGIDLAIEACTLLIQQFPDLRWLVIGEGTERTKLENEIKEKGLSYHFFLLGLRDNPYPYIKKATIYVQPSRYEGKSIAVDEAKILAKPIVVTNFTTAKDQINSGINGLITEMNPEAIAHGIKDLLEQEEKRASFTSNLKQEKLGTEKEINKLYSIINS